MLDADASEGNETLLLLATLAAMFADHPIMVKDVAGWLHHPGIVAGQLEFCLNMLAC